jgi:hypothetical protein
LNEAPRSTVQPRKRSKRDSYCEVDMRTLCEPYNGIVVPSETDPE